MLPHCSCWNSAGFDYALTTPCLRGSGLVQACRESAANYWNNVGIKLPRVDEVNGYDRVEEAYIWFVLFFLASNISGGNVLISAQWSGQIMKFHEWQSPGIIQWKNRIRNYLLCVFIATTKSFIQACFSMLGLEEQGNTYEYLPTNHIDQSNVTNIFLNIQPH